MRKVPKNLAQSETPESAPKAPSEAKAAILVGIDWADKEHAYAPSNTQKPFTYQAKSDLASNRRS